MCCLYGLSSEGREESDLCVCAVCMACPQRGEIEFEVVYVAPEVDSDDENVEYEDESGHRYRLYLDELEEATGPSRSNGTADNASLQGTCHCD